jgi:hypothetical protein
MTARALIVPMVAALVVGAGAERPVRLDLVRCTALSDAPCLRSSEAIGARRVVFDAGADGVAGLARTTMRRVTATGAPGIEMAWRPPLLAMPTFRGTADSASLSPALHEALLLGNGGGGNRELVALLIAVLLGFAWTLVFRLGAHDADAAPARDRPTATRTGIASASAEEAPPRGAEDVTQQTARRTALGR